LQILRAEACGGGGGGGATMSASGGGGGVVRPAPAAPSGAGNACMRVNPSKKRDLCRAWDVREQLLTFIRARGKIGDVVAPVAT